MRRRSEAPALAALGAVLLGLAAAPAAAASLAVTEASAHAGGYGLEIVVGSTCTSPDSLVLSPGGDLEGDFEACADLTAQDAVVTGAGVTLTAGETIVLGEAFSVAAGAELAVGIEPLLATGFASLEDPSPIDETDYHAVFYVELDGLALAAGDEIAHLAGYSAAGESQFVLTLRKSPAAVDSLHLAARENGGGLVQMTPGQELPLAPGWNKIEIDFHAGAADGALLVAVNDGAWSGLTSLVNDAARIETVRLGAIDGTLSTTAGTLRLDGFDSWR